MFTQTHLNLRSVSLEARDEWGCQGKGLFFIFAQEGIGTCVCGEGSLRVSPGDVVVQDATTGAKLCVTEGRLAFKYFSVGLEQLVPLFVVNEISHLRNLSGALKKPKLYLAGSPVARKCRELLRTIPAQFNLDHRSQLLRVAAAVIALELASMRTTPAENERHIAGVLKKISATELLNLPVAALAHKYGCSRRHLNRLFHQRFGVSVAALKMEMRLLKATSLLQNPETKIIRVAEECGFNQLGVFNIRFKRRFGSSPGQWRKMAIQIQDQPLDMNSGSTHCSLLVSGLCPFSTKDTPRIGTGRGRSLPNKRSNILETPPSLLVCGITTLTSPKAAPRIPG